MSNITYFGVTIGFLLIICTSSTTTPQYHGPFMLWGLDKLKDLKISTLEMIDDKILAPLYEEADVILMFLKNNTNRMNGENYPGFKRLVDDNPWTYLAQHHALRSETGLHKNFNTTVLNGTFNQQDDQLLKLYNEVVRKHGKGKVLGILANTNDEKLVLSRGVGHRRVHKTEVQSSDHYPKEDNSEEHGSWEEEEMDDHYIFIDKGQAILHTTSPPVLHVMGQKLELKENYVKGKFEHQDSLGSFKIHLNHEEEMVLLIFQFTLKSGYWYLTCVEVQYKHFHETLNLKMEKPNAPLGFSYACSREVVFQQEKNSLVFADIQVQPFMDGRIPFGDAQNCIGFTTVPIWSGIFVSFLLIFVTMIGLTALMDIKTPDHFEDKFVTLFAQEEL